MASSFHCNAAPANAMPILTIPIGKRLIAKYEVAVKNDSVMNIGTMVIIINRVNVLHFPEADSINRP